MSNPRPFKATIGDYTRSTEVRELLEGGCDLRNLLSRTNYADTGGDPSGLPTHQYISYYGMGTAVHTAIERITLGEDKDMAIAEAQFNLVQEMHGHDDIIYSNARPDKVSVIDAVEECVENWWLDAHPDSLSRLSYYKGFDWPPVTELTLVDDELKVSTQADALFATLPEALSNTSHAIVDYKSGMGKQADSLQLHIYWYLAKRLGHIPEDAGFFGFFHHVTHRAIQIADAYPGDEYIEAAFAKVHAIKESRTYLPNKGWYCKYCPFQAGCPAFGAMTYGELMSMIDIEYVSGVTLTS